MPSIQANISSSAVAQQLNGTWCNELGSRMELFATVDGNLAGQYDSAVGNAKKRYPLTGRFDITPPLGKGASLAWTVAWFNKVNGDSFSATGWSGQFFPGDEPLIRTMWLLTRATTFADAWEATIVGYDNFTLCAINKSTREVVAEKRAKTSTLASLD